ncbi:hypothetical protein V7166_21915 [Bacillus thuringiensis]
MINQTREVVYIVTDIIWATGKSLKHFIDNGSLERVCKLNEVDMEEVIKLIEERLR